MIKHIIVPLHRLHLAAKVEAINQAIEEHHRDAPPSEAIVRALMHRNAAERRLRALSRSDGHRYIVPACGAVAGMLALALAAQAFGWLPGVLS